MEEIDELYLRGTLDYNTTYPTISPTESSLVVAQNSYTQEDKNFIGVFFHATRQFLEEG
jgi:hypothetical protein